MTAAALVERLQARGVILKPEGANLRIRPFSLLTPAEIAALRELKPEVLRLLTSPAVRLDAQTTAEVLGPDPAPADLAAARREVSEAVDVLTADIAAGVVASRLLLVRGRPLADWLDLAEVAALLRAWRDRTARS